MRYVLVTVLCAGLVAAAAPGAQAHPDYHYDGRCHLTVVSDGTDSPGTGWEGEASVTVVATEEDATPAPSASISARCDLYIDAVFDKTLLTASGTGGASDSTTVRFQADPDSLITVCTEVLVGGDPHVFCEDYTPVRPVPGPVEDLVDELDPSGPVVGYIEIADTGSGPGYTLHGDLATPRWSCSVTSTVPYTVSCAPTPVLTELTYHCDVLHADVLGLSLSARARTSLDCDGDGAYEAQTAVVVGPLIHMTWAASTVRVTEFSCRVDGGNDDAATASYRAGCGDPGVVRFNG